MFTIELVFVLGTQVIGHRTTGSLREKTEGQLGDVTVAKTAPRSRGIRNRGVLEIGFT